MLTDVARNKTEVSGMGYTRSVDPTGVMYPVKNGMGPGNADQLVWLYGNNLEGMDVNFRNGAFTVGAASGTAEGKHILTPKKKS